MDIFTTYLTRVVPVPIKPTNLKVKALLKESNINHLTQDPDHLENHPLYFDGKVDKKSDEQSHGKDSKKQDTEKKDVHNKSSKIESTPSDDEVDNEEANGDTQTKGEIKHLDLYV